MQPPDDVEGTASQRGAAGAPVGPRDGVGPGEQDSAEAESPAAEGPPQVQGASQDSGQPGAAPQVQGASRDSGQPGAASVSVRDLGGPVPEFILTVPFLSYVDAEVARRYLMAGAETYHGRVLWDLRVTGGDLLIRLTAEDSDLLQSSAASMLHRLSIVVQTMQNFVPPFCAKCQCQKGA